MRRILGSFLLLMLAVAPAAMAQTQPAPRAERVMPIPGVQLADQILAQREQLGLTQQQVTQIRELRAQLERQNRPLADQLRATQQRQLPQRAAQQQPGRAQQQRQAAQLRQRGANLSDEQRAEMRTRMRARQDSMWARQDSMRARTRGRQDTMRARLQSLTDEQRQAVQQMMRQRQVMMGRGALQPRTTPQPMRPGNAPMMRGNARDARATELQQQLRAHNQQAMQQIEAILTPAQRTQLRELRQGRGGR